MSKPEAEKPEETIGKIVLAGVIRAIEDAFAALREGDVESATVFMDLGWTLLPVSIRNVFPDRPSDVIEKRAKAEVPTHEALAGLPRFAGRSWFRLDGERNRLRHHLADRTITELAAAYTAEADKQGFYINRAGYTVGSEHNAKEQPPTKGLPTTMPRGTT